MPITQFVPSFSVQVAWSSTLTGIFTVGTSTVGGTDVVGGGGRGATFASVNADAFEATIQRGRPTDLQTMQQGTCTLKLKDPGGQYNPLNPSSAFYGQTVPMRPVRIRAT